MLGIGENDKIILVKNDDTDAIKSLQNQKAYVVTYGLSSKATFTASSIEKNQIVVCLQRTILDVNGNVIEPQEFAVSLIHEYDPELVILIIAICIINGVPIDMLSKFMF